MASSEEEVKRKIFSTFADVASSLGYSPLHGKIIGVLVVNGKPQSLQEIAKETGYSVSMISLSLDLLEVLGVIKKIKKPGDRKLYVDLKGDLLEVLKNAITIKVQKSVRESLAEFEESKKTLERLGIKGDTLNSLETLEKQIKRLETYVNMLARIKLP